MSETNPSLEIEVLTEDECWALLQAGGLGRLATAAKGMVDVFPINFLVHDRTVLFRSGPGSKLVNLTAAPLVAFEADSFDGRWHSSVVIHGRATRLDNDEEISRPASTALSPGARRRSSTTCASRRPTSPAAASTASPSRARARPEKTLALLLSVA